MNPDSRYIEAVWNSMLEPYDLHVTTGSQLSNKTDICPEKGTNLTKLIERTELFSYLQLAIYELLFFLNNNIIEICSIAELFPYLTRKIRIRNDHNRYVFFEWNMRTTSRTSMQVAVKGACYYKYKPGR